MKHLICCLALLSAMQANAIDRWQKTDSQGRALPVSAGPWSCIRDLKTGLLWENKTDNEGLHFNAATYSWFDATHRLGVEKAGSCSDATMKVSPCDTRDLIVLANQQAWCGASHWRVPSAKELASLLLDTGFAGNPRIASGFFPHTGRFPYWTADLRQSNNGKTEALILHFGSGSTQWLGTQHAARLRLVATP
ncbi:DUF1566 domain-containing protein [uncultured Deefgea sp.]|uniref:Lcl C-terminal domain-containing protein n=1 Tax=uncultured Deefgea sp. TaxID=1304914 RepID=UPI0025915F16|nr:DUF1566 domain-containing protein [uncultured Deefgea sp.]